MKVGVFFWRSSMNYKRQYDLLIEKAQHRDALQGYTELHHIIPRCMGGSDSPENLVSLTAREHYLAHRLLYMHYKTPKLAYAWKAMYWSNPKKRKLTSRQYEKIKVAISESLTGRPVKPFTEEHRKNISKAQKGKVLSEEHRKKISDAGRKRVFSEETRAKISQALRGKPVSDETKQKLSEVRKGRILTKEHREKLSLAFKGKPITEEHRKKISKTKQLKKRLGLDKAEVID